MEHKTQISSPYADIPDNTHSFEFHVFYFKLPEIVRTQLKFRFSNSLRTFLEGLEVANDRSREVNDLTSFETELSDF